MNSERDFKPNKTNEIRKVKSMLNNAGIIRLTCVLITIIFMNAFSMADDHLDTTLPREIIAAPYEGERYEALVPDTLDLVDHANMALNVLTHNVAPEWDYEIYTYSRFAHNPPLMEIGHGGLLNLAAKWLEAIPGLRVMSGSTMNAEIDGKLMGSLVHITGKDGLCYHPVEDRPWACFDEYTQKNCQPHCDIFGEARQLLAYGVWYQHDKNPMWKMLAERKMNRLRELTMSREDTLFFRLSRGFVPGDAAEGEIVPMADHGIYDIEKGMTGSPATYIVGFFPQATSNWYRLTGYQPGLELGGGLANYLYTYGEMINPDTGEWLADHFAHISHTMLGCLPYALTVDDRQMIKWIKKGFNWVVGEWDADRTGVLISDGTCACFMADLIDIGIMLSRAGEGDYWETIDGWVRNTLSNGQAREEDMAAVKAQPVDYKDKADLKPGQYQFEGAADQCVGAWFHSLTVRDHSVACCNGNCNRALYYVWDSIVTQDERQLRVNLLLNRSSPWVDIDSYLPFEGKVVLAIKKKQKNLLVRIPEWTNWNKITCSVNGKPREFSWSMGSYIDVGKARKGDQVVIEFPMRRRTIHATLHPSKAGTSLEDRPNHAAKCEVELRGNTIVNMTPDLGMLIVRNNEKYRNEKVSMRKITRFVSDEQFLW
jgi:hypothetical protein